MTGRIRRLLLMQGFCQRDMEGVPGISGLARWTPLSCAAFGTAGLAAGSTVLPLGATLCPCAIEGMAGLWMGSGWFFLVLGLLTLTGGLTSRSIYDRLYNGTFMRILRTAAVPQHGAPRRFGCTIGGIMYTLSGVGFLLGNLWIAFIPALFMVVFATVAGLTQWCFASALYTWLFVGKEETAAIGIGSPLTGTPSHTTDLTDRVPPSRTGRLISGELQASGQNMTNRSRCDVSVLRDLNVRIRLSAETASGRACNASSGSANIRVLVPA